MKVEVLTLVPRRVREACIAPDLSSVVSDNRLIEGTDIAPMYKRALRAHACA